MVGVAGEATVSALRAARAAEAARLRAEGLTYERIAVRMGISRSYASCLVSDPTGEQDAARKASYGGECEVCGARTDGSYGRALAPKVCAKCAPVFYAPTFAAKRGTGPVMSRALALCAEPIRYADLRDALGVSNGWASVLLHRMVRYGLIERVSRGVYRARAAS